MIKEIANHQVEMSDDGFLSDPNQWNEEIGIALAAELDLRLTDKHWEVIRFARSDFADTGKSPGPRRIVSNTSISMKELYQLFPKGPGKLVAQVAGVPKPKSCL